MSEYAASPKNGMGRFYDLSAFLRSEFEELRKHAQTCQRSRDLMFWCQCVFEEVRGRLRGRIITLLVFATLIMIAAGAVAGD